MKPGHSLPRSGTGVQTLGRLRLALVLLALAPCVLAQTEAAYPPPGKLVDLGGYRIHLYCTGSGTPTVMILGSGGSFDWGLVQPEVAQFATVCSFDPAGTAWSDPHPAVTCTQRIDEIHCLLGRAGINGPLVLVGHSIGGAIARLYAARYRRSVAGMVIVDHAGQFQVPPGTRIIPRPFDEEPAFKKLPLLNQQLHRWADSQPAQSSQGPAIYQECLSQLEKTTQLRPDPLGNLPLAVVSNGVFQASRDYRKLQDQLLALSHNSRRADCCEEWPRDPARRARGNRDRDS
jgi:pimeloyl-ACP methyl ester carboxylesterase